MKARVLTSNGGAAFLVELPEAITDADEVVDRVWKGIVEGRTFHGAYSHNLRQRRSARFNASHVVSVTAIKEED